MALYHRHVIGRPGFFVTFVTAEPLGMPVPEGSSLYGRMKTRPKCRCKRRPKRHSNDTGEISCNSEADETA